MFPVSGGSVSDSDEKATIPLTDIHDGSYKSKPWFHAFSGWDVNSSLYNQLPKQDPGNKFIALKKLFSASLLYFSFSSNNEK